MEGTSNRSLQSQKWLQFVGKGFLALEIQQGSFEGLLLHYQRSCSNFQKRDFSLAVGAHSMESTLKMLATSINSAIFLQLLRSWVLFSISEALLSGEVHQNMKKLLRLSHEEKNIFLDMACFFRGRKRDDVITILNSFGFQIRDWNRYPHPKITLIYF